MLPGDLARLVDEDEPGLVLDAIAVCHPARLVEGDLVRQRPELVQEASSIVGNQCIVVAIDAKKSATGWEVFTHGGRKPTGLDAVQWARRMEQAGAGEILLTSMDRDGTRDGFDIALTRAVSDAVGIPVIASGGVGRVEDFAEGVLRGGASAVLAASVFHFGDLTVRQVKHHMRARGIEVRA